MAPTSQPSPTPPTGKRALLDLDAFQAREFITISGEHYEYRNPEEFTVLELRRFDGLADRAGELERLDEHDVDQASEYRRVLAAAVGLILVAPPALIAKLEPMHGLLIMRTFSALLQRRLLLTGANRALPTGAPTPTGASTRRGSRASTQGRRRKVG